MADFVLTFREEHQGYRRSPRLLHILQLAGSAEFYYVHLGARPDPHSGQIMIVKTPCKAMINNKNDTPWKNETWHSEAVRDSKAARSPFILTIYQAHMQVSDRPLAGRIGIGSFDDMNDFDDIHLRGRQSCGTKKDGGIVRAPICRHSKRHVFTVIAGWLGGISPLCRCPNFPKPCAPT